MATKEELSEQLNITQKLAAITNTMAEALGRVESSYSTQVDSVKELTRAIENLKGQDLGSMNDIKLDNLRKQLLNSEKGAKSLNARVKELGTEFKNKFPKTIAVASAGLIGFVQGIRNVLAVGKGLLGLLESVGDFLVNVGASIISIPFKLFDRLVGAAAKGAGGMNELAEAIREVMIQFGDLKGPGAHAVMTTGKTLKGFSDTGLSAWRVFGNLAERIKYFNKVATAMGATFSRMTKEFEENGGALAAYQKGLGLSDEQMKAVGDRALTMGKPFVKVFLDMTKQTTALGKAFGISQKIIGRDMAKALQDVKHFGALATKEIGQAVVYSHKLGVELDKIAGVLDAFETFDSAAENVAKLSQTFGVQIDAFQMMEEQNPAKQIDVLRKSFRDAGVDASKFSRQEAKLLAQSTGLDEATVRQVFSLQNAGESYDEIRKKSESAEKKTMTQAEAMGKLADSIERLVQQGQAMEGGFFKMFMQGFSRGIQSSKEFWGIMRNIRFSLMTVMMEGLRLGKAFVKIFPGVNDILTGISDFFQPAKFKALTKGVVDVFIEFFKDLSDPNSKASFSGLMEKLKKGFFKFFDKEEPACKKMLEGFKTVFKTISFIVAEGIKWVSDKIAAGILYVVDLINGKRKIGVPGAAGSLGFLEEIFAPILLSLMHAWKVITPALWKLVTTIGSKILEYFQSEKFASMIEPVKKYIVFALFGPAMTRMLASAAITSIGAAITSAVTSSTMKKSITSALSSVQTTMNKVPGVSGNGAVTTVEQTGKFSKAARKASKEANRVEWHSLARKLLLITGVVAIGLTAFAVALWAFSKYSFEEIITAGAALTMGMLVAAEAAGIAFLIEKTVGNVKFGELLKGLGFLALTVTAVGLVTWGLVKVFGDIPKSKLQAVGGIMKDMTLVFLGMVPLIASAGILGVIIAATGGIGLAAIAVGMSAISAAVVVMASAAMMIINKLASLQIDEGFQVKVDAFLGVMKAIQAFTDSLIKVIDLMKPSLSELLFGGNRDFAKRAEAAQNLIKEIIGSKEGGGVIGIANTFLGLVSGIETEKGIAEKAQVFSDIMQAVSSVMEAIKPPDKFFEAGSSFMVQMGEGDNAFASLTNDIANYMQEMRQAMFNVITTGIMPLIKQITGIRIPNPTETEVVVKLIGALGEIIKGMSPSPELAQTFKNVKDSSHNPLKAAITEFDAEGAVKFFQAAQSQMMTLMPIITMNLAGLIAMMSQFKPEQMENLKVMGPIISSISSIISSVVKGTRGKEVTPMEVNKTVHWAVKEAPDYALVFKSLGTALPELINSVVKSISAIKVGANFPALVKTAEQIFGFIKTLTDVAGTLTGVGGGQTKAFEPTQAFHAFQKLAVFTKLLISGGGGFDRGEWGKAADSPLPLLIKDLQNMASLGLSGAKGTAVSVAESLSSLFDSLKKIVESVRTISSVYITPEMTDATIASIVSLSYLIEQLTKSGGPLTNIQGIIEGSGGVLSKSAKSLKDMSTYFRGMSASIKDSGVVPALQAVAEMVRQTQDLDDQLANLPKLGPIQNRLGALAKAAGLGGRAVYTVKSKDVNINVDFCVVMEVDRLEKIMVFRENSFIRNRVNYLLGKDDTGKTNLLPSNPNDHADIIGFGIRETDTAGRQ